MLNIYSAGSMSLSWTFSMSFSFNVTILRIQKFNIFAFYGKLHGANPTNYTFFKLFSEQLLPRRLFASIFNR